MSLSLRLDLEIFMAEIPKNNLLFTYQKHGTQYSSLHSILNRGERGRTEKLFAGKIISDTFRPEKIQLQNHFRGKCTYLHYMITSVSL